MSVASLARRHGLPAGAEEQIVRLLTALEAEADPPTSVRERVAALQTHVADSLSGVEVAALREATPIADVGSGAGFPGLVLAIALPANHVDMLEGSRRKGAVIDRLAAAAGVRNARTVVARAEQWAILPPVAGGGREAYAAVTARAVAPLAALIEYAAPLLRRGGVLVAWKGARDLEEERAGRAAADGLAMAVEEVRRVVPFEGARHRHLHVVRKVAATPAGFPRRPGMARKRPLA